MIRIYRINTGSCGGCDLMIGALTRTDSEFNWAATPFEADVLLLTGPVVAAGRPALFALLRELDGQVPLVAVGRCAIDGAPYGRGGIAEIDEISAAAEVDGCPPAPATLAAAIRAAVAPAAPRRGGRR